MEPCVTDEEIDGVLKYVECFLQMRCKEFFDANDRSVRALTDFLQRLEAIGREAQAIPRSREHAETRAYRSYTFGDLHLIKALAAFDDDMGKTASYGTWQAHSFARNCERLLERVSKIDPELRSPGDEIDLLMQTKDASKAISSFERNLSRYSANTREGKILRLGMVLGALHSDPNVVLEHASPSVNSSPSGR